MITSVPVHLKNSYKSELDNIEQQGVIRKVTQYTDWVNDIVLVKRKNNTIRVCLDPRQLNKNIVTSNYLMRRLDDILQKMTNAKYFTVVDTKMAHICKVTKANYSIHSTLHGENIVLNASHLD